MVKKYLFFLLVILALAVALVAGLTVYFYYQPAVLSKNNKDNNMTKKEIIRQPAVAGSFYSADINELSSMIDQFLAKVPSETASGTPRILIVPHAGLEYSGQVAAYSFRQLVGSDIKKAIIIGPSHHFADSGLFLSGASQWQTPLGLVKIADLNQTLSGQNNFFVSEKIHQPEHALEIEVPFLQTVISDVEIVPIIVGQLNTNQRLGFASILNKYLDDQTVLIVSVDLSHYHTQTKALDLDNLSIKHILALDSVNILNDEIDAPWAVASVLELAKQNNWQAKLLKHATSGDITGDQLSVVGYGAVGFYGEVKNKKSEIRDQKLVMNIRLQKRPNCCNWPERRWSSI